VNDKRRVSVSKFLSKHLRHTPEAIGLTLADGGWVPIPDLLAAAERHRFPITRDELDHVVRTCDKQRYAVDLATDRIRANQGHSVEVELNLESLAPPGVLYHGTATRFREPILKSGLLKMSRQHVHLSADRATAVAVGKRHGSPTVFAVDTMSMVRDGHEFFRAANGVWLTDRVPPQYLREDLETLAGASG
jgi:putative RNA 2'-phosphotransferase